MAPTWQESARLWISVLRGVQSLAEVGCVGLSDTPGALEGCSAVERRVPSSRSRLGLAEVTVSRR